jgi:hypothetical protein
MKTGARRRAGAALLLVFAAAAATASGERLRGRPLAEAIDSLRREGLPIVYSTSLVTPAMIVRDEPRATTPRAILEEIVAQHGLGVRGGPGGTLIVVAATAAVPAERSTSTGGAPTPVMPMLLDEIVVTPSHYRLLNEEPEARRSLTREQIERMPHLGGDTFWAVKRLPGTSGSDVSARFNVRGGDGDELLVVLDGLELFEPFHLKDFMNVFSTLDAAAIGTVDLLTGGFPVEYGDRMSGVMEITSVSPGSLPPASVSIGTLNSNVILSGAGGSGWSWLLAARGWYPDLLFEGATHLADELNTDYADLFAKARRDIGARSSLTLAYLAAWDDLALAKHDPDETERVDAEYASHHLWASLATAWTPAVRSRTVFSAGSLSRRRAGMKIEGGVGALETSDDRSFDFLGAKQDWTFEAGARHVVKGGLDLRRQRARYDYATESTFEPSEAGPGGNPSDRSFAIELRPTGESWGAYLADRIRITPSLIAEAGLRWDKQFWIEDNQVSPRVQLRWDSGSWVVRTAWGRYFQSQRLNELQVDDGVTTFYPAQSSEHSLASVEHYFRSGLGVRVEAYLKEMNDLRPRWENLFNPLELFPEAQTDRVLVAPERGTARGIELVAKGAARRGVNWWASYGWAEAVDAIDGERVPRNWDQRHTASASVDWDLSGGWALNLGAAWHSGWPTTGVIARGSGDPDAPEVELIAGERNGERLPAYLRIDARVSRAFATRAGEVTLIGEILNLANRDNVCCVDDYTVRPQADGAFTVERDDRYWPPVTPTFALRWRP